MADQIDNSNAFEGKGDSGPKRAKWGEFDTPRNTPRRSSLLFRRREPKKQWKLKKWVRIVFALLFLPLMAMLGYIIFDTKSGGVIKGDETPPKITPKKKTALFVTSTPEAEIYLNGISRGKTPVEKGSVKIEDLSVGKYKLELKNPDFADSLITEFTWPQDKDDTISYAFQTLKMSSLEVITDRETQVYVDKEFRGAISPLLIQNLIPGKHQALFKNPEIWGNWTTEITLKPGKRERLEYHWKIGSLSVNADPWGTVFIDDKNAGTTPLSIEKIKAGRYNMKVVREGMQDHEEVIVIIQGETTEVSIGN